MATNAEKEFYQLSISISKAVNGLEAPLKSKHARSIIITIHKYREAKTFWTILTRQPIMENKFTAWKFCHLLHKVLREAHESALRHSQKHSNMILEVGKSWGHLQDDIGHCIKAYSKLLVTKLNFHDKNRMIPGSLLITFAQIATIAERDVNYYFQLCVEIFDYLEDIIAVQVAVFSSINTYRISSMTQQGQCRLAPIITLIQDSNPLYDISVRLMFKLHEKLPNDVLTGHRERFSGLFNKLKFFYESVRPLQYFHDLISVPQLPERSPDFRSQVDFGSYIPPVVLVQSEPDLVVNELVDTNSSTNTVEEDPVLIERINTLENVIEEKNETIERLKEKLNTDEINLERLQHSYRQNIIELQNTNTALSNELATTQEMCSNIRMEKDDLELKLANNPILIQKVYEEEEKQKLSQEKFNKLKNMYTQIRDEHINLLRQHGEFTKSLNKEKQANAELMMQIKEINEELVKKNESIDETKMNESKLLLEIENQRTYTSHLESVEKENKKEYEDFLKKKENEVLQAVNALKEIENELNNIKLILSDKEKKLVQAESLISIKDTEHADNQKVNEEKYQKLSTTHKELEDIFQKDSQALRAVLDETSQKLKERENALQATETSLSSLQEEKLKSEELISELQQKLVSKDDDLVKTIQKAESLDQEVQTLRELLKENTLTLKEKENVLLESEISLASLQKEKIKSQELFNELQQKMLVKEDELVNTIKKVESLKAINQQCHEKLMMMRKLTIETVKEICLSKINNEQQETAEIISKITLETDALLHKLKNSAEEPNECTEKIHDIICLGNFFIQLYDQCNIIYLSTTEIEKGQDILNKVHSLCPDLVNLFELSQKDNTQEEIQSVVSDIQKKLIEINELVQGALNNFENNVDLEKLIEIELKEMDIAIEDAASKIIDLISKTRENDNKIKLEVNEKILEACTSLMECIKVLIFKSRVLQREIVSSQKGNASTNEFYKRNSQWSDGLISASKSVAKAANYLVEAANNAVNSESGQNFELIVAAQEIAACTVQLVIASKVKANLNSENLANLTAASKNVTKATGVVVATVKDGNARQEQEQDNEFSKLTPSQLKTMEMEIQVKVLELEQALQTQRFKLSSFRKEHYQKSEY